MALHGVGIDRGLPSSTALALRHLARRAVEVSVRDAESAVVLREWEVDGGRRPRSVELAAPGQECRRGRLPASGGPGSARPIVGLALTAVNPALADAVLEASVACADAFPEVQFCFVPMSQHPSCARHNDLVLGRRLRLAPRAWSFWTGCPIRR